MTSLPTMTASKTTLYTMSGTIQPAAPFDFSRTLDFLDMFTPMQREQTMQAHILTKAIMVGGQTVAFRVQSGGNVDAPRLDYTLHSNAPISAKMQKAVEDRIRFFLSTDEDLRPLYALAEQDSVFAPIARQLYGLHQVKFLTPFEIAAWAILAQRQPMRVAQKIKHRIMEQFGGSVEIDSVIYRAFPEGEQMIAADYDTLQAVVQNERKTAYLLDVIRAFAGVDEDFLRRAPVAEVEVWLRAIKGIGAWSASFILIRGLGRMDHLPDQEPKLEGVIEKRYGKGHTIPELAAHYGEWKGYWSYYLRTTGERE